MRVLLDENMPRKLATLFAPDVEALTVRVPQHSTKKMAIQTLNDHIEVTPGVVGGKPRIAGRRITVQNIVIWHERMGRGADEIATEYDLTLSDVYAALAYYYDHREEIDQSIREGEAFAEAMRAKTPSKVKEKLHGRSA